MKKIPIPLIIAGVLFFIFKDLFFKREPPKPNFKFPAAKEIPVNYNQNSIQNIDTSQYLDNLCERTVTSSGTTSTVLKIINFVPCNWKENFSTEKQGAICAYSTVDEEGKGVTEMGLLISELPYVLSPKQRKDFFSIESIKKVAEEANAISYRKSSLSGLDCHEIIFKKNNLSEAPGATSYAIHFETIFKNKYIALTYGVAYKDSIQSRKVFYQYLPLFRVLSQKFKILN